METSLGCTHVRYHINSNAGGEQSRIEVEDTRHAPKPF